MATGVGAGTYFVRVKAINGDTIGLASNEVSLTVSAATGSTVTLAGTPAPVRQRRM
jgi:hypothetical protein